MIGLYVKPDHRRNGVGKHLFEKVINFARETNCNHLDFHVMAGNPAQEFYAKLHAKNLTEESGYLVYRLTKDQIYETSDEIWYAFTASRLYCIYRIELIKNSEKWKLRLESFRRILSSSPVVMAFY